MKGTVVKYFVFALVLVLVIWGVFTLVSLLFQQQKTLSLEESQRVSVEIFENLAESPLTSDKSIFLLEELDKYRGTSQEPYAHHCSYGYSAYIEKKTNIREVAEAEECSDFCNRVCGIPLGEIEYKNPSYSWDGPFNNFCYEIGGTCQCCDYETEEYCDGRSDDTISFGYESNLNGLSIGGASYTQEYMVSLQHEDEFVPATIELTVERDWFTELTCLIQKGRMRRDRQEMLIPCIKPDERIFSGLDCVLPVRNKNNSPDSDYICVFGPTETTPRSVQDYQCRYMEGVTVFPFLRPYTEKNTLPVRKIKVIPITEQGVLDLQDKYEVFVSGSWSTSQRNLIEANKELCGYSDSSGSYSGLIETRYRIDEDDKIGGFVICLGG